MNNILNLCLSLARNPMFSTKYGKVCYINDEAELLFGSKLAIGTDCSEMFSGVGTISEFVKIYTSISIGGAQYMAVATSVPPYMVVSVYPPIETPPERNIGIEYTTVNKALKSAANMKVNIEELISNLRNNNENEDTGENVFCELFHNYFSVLHSLDDLNLFCSFAGNHIERGISDFDLATICRGIANTCRMVFKEDSITVDCRAVDSVMMSSDANMVDRLVLSLIAYAYTRLEQNKGRISLNAHSEKPDFAVISVADNGGQVPEAVVKRIVNESKLPSIISLNYENENEASSYLRVARCLSEALGGVFRLESNISGDVKFTVELPRVFVSDNLLHTSYSPYRPNMKNVLTTFSDILPSDFYTENVVSQRLAKLGRPAPPQNPQN